MSVSRVFRTISAKRSTWLIRHWSFVIGYRLRFNDLTQGIEEAVDLLVGADADPQALGIAGIGHQADQDLAVLELLERRRAGGPPVAQTKLDWLSGTW